MNKQIPSKFTTDMNWHSHCLSAILIVNFSVNGPSPVSPFPVSLQMHLARNAKSYYKVSMQVHVHFSDKVTS